MRLICTYRYTRCTKLAPALTLPSRALIQGAAFAERDLTEPDVQMEAKERYGVRVAPITVIGDRFFYGAFEKQKAKIAPLL